MIVAAAQTIPEDGDIEANIADHLRFATMAANEGARLILFPEMSLTGYVMETAKELSFTQNDPRLESLKKLAVQKDIIIIAGAPIAINTKLHIGAFVIIPDSSVLIYTKQFLHKGEELFFEHSFDYNPLLELDGQKISIAICADISNPRHPENAGKKDTSIYAAGIFYSTPTGIIEAYEHLSIYAKKYHMNVLMSNYGGPSNKLESQGVTAFWNNKGELIKQLGKEGEGLLVIEL
jgi:predicted amidohydrolase